MIIFSITMEIFYVFVICFLGCMSHDHIQYYHGDILLCHLIMFLLFVFRTSIVFKL